MSPVSCKALGKKTGPRSPAPVPRPPFPGGRGSGGDPGTSGGGPSGPDDGSRRESSPGRA